MKSSQHGASISEAEVTQIDGQGIWLLVSGAEYFLPYEEYPWFRSARVEEILNVELLDGELSRARVVPPAEVPPDVVTMNSRLRYVNHATGGSRTVTLVYPSEANFEAGRLSILTPVGCALLGLAVGQAIDWTMPNRQLRKFVVEELLYQPEAAGDLRL